MADDDNITQHALVSSWFLGPRAENFQVLHDLFGTVLNHQAQARKTLYAGDPEFITEGMKELEDYQNSIKTLTSDVDKLSLELAAKSVPFWSPRYNAHMNMDVALSSIVGYMTAMMYNPNNVATEASPHTTKLEREVGQELARMLGYGTDSWGHITCDGSVANLEAIWAIRNLKFYPFSLKRAIEEGSLNFLAGEFEVKTSTGDAKLFTELSTWELLNLKPSTILEIPSTLAEQYSISSTFLQAALKPYLIQTTGKSVIEQKYGFEPGKFLISATKHYSWPKGGAISGIGSINFIDVDVDEEARMDTNDLRKRLKECVDAKIPIYGVVAIIGSTEHGACDPVAEIVKIRDEFERDEGVSFAIHCDAAWGGYFAATLRERGDQDGFLPYVPAMPLQPYTMKQLRNLHHAESITIDPHKSGYINYPAGGLCYRDQRMRYLVTWTSPIVFHQGDALESMGVYGVEGSKPGAAATAAWLTHKTIGLHNDGYGRLLGEAVFSCTKLYCYWATMAPSPESESGADETQGEPDPEHESLKKSLVVVPLIRLPAEKAGESPEAIEAQKELIRNKILNRTNEELFEDKKTWKLLCELAGDLMINAFACNFKIGDDINQDVGEANYLNQWIFSQLSVSSDKDVAAARPLFLTSSVFGEEAYGRCLRTFKTRLGLDDGINLARGDLRFLVNVTMSPWPTSPDFMKTIVKDFKAVALEGIKRCIKRNKLSPDVHGFVIQGVDEIYLTHIPMFNMANHRWQLVITGDLPPDVVEYYKKLRSENPGVVYTLANMEKETLENLLKPGSSTKWRLDVGIPPPGAPPLKDNIELSNIRVIVKESMSYAALETTYPDRMPFYLYGNKNEVHLDHLLKASPNAQISHERVTLDLESSLSDEQLRKGVVAVLDDVFENSIQPLPLDNDTNRVLLESAGLSLTKGAVHSMSVYETYEQYKNGSAPITTGKVTIGETTFANWPAVNMDPADEEKEEEHKHKH
ncbi:uncharacterized protein QC764_708110 [Podospora pseudoanserina]|uniref:L-tyrosine decarboxylase n=1 Tax=Podospora pseudoanserina TaxID=2609844 RepID=A0ABR0HKG0_9PEZI|nr:hypothetical protein QC764_708110 [Podospora pseudoanserina]